jgi:hypothetical protein
MSDELKQLTEIIRQKSREFAPEYPGIKDDMPVFEHLWAITSSLEGTNKANDDWHDFFDFVVNYTGLNKIDLIKLYEDHKKGKPK